MSSNSGGFSRGFSDGVAGGFSSMEEHQASALLSSRAALVGPYAGATLQAKEPPFDKPDNLTL